MFHNYILRKGLFKGGSRFRLYSGAFVLACLLVFILFSLFFSLAPAHAVDVSCSNRSQWDTGRQSKDFAQTVIVPNNYPIAAWTLEEAMNTLYDPDEYEITIDNPPNCATYSCLDETFNGSFAHKANPSICSCLIGPQVLCGNIFWYVTQQPELTSGPRGTAMPPFPTPEYPVEWDDEYFYVGVYEGAVGSIPAYLLSRVPDAVKTGTTFVETCSGFELVGTGDSVAEKRKFIINNLRTVEQTFEQWYSPYSWSYDFGVCGNFTWSWTEGPHENSTLPAKNFNVAVEVNAAIFGETVEPAELGCPNGALNPDGVTCSGSFSANNSGDCPSGWVFTYGPFGSSTCSTSSSDLAAICTSGVLATDTSTNPPTYTCIGGSFSYPDPIVAHICGNDSPPPVPVSGSFDGSVPVINDTDNDGIITLVASPPGSPNVPPPENDPVPETPPAPTTDPAPLINPNTRGVLNSDGARLYGIDNSPGFVGSCRNTHRDVQLSLTDDFGFYPRGLIGNDCKSAECLYGIAKCEFDQTKFGGFLAGLSSLQGPGSLPSFNISFGSFGAGNLDMNTPAYISGLSIIRNILLLMCFVVSLRIFAT
jgi:hypothetical protein